ncbi:hypothetical protein E8E15_001114 [Penicillium rubens]|jgi:hypothetical protein|uniref:uncharacterized protein n=1 Tax=Penicillium rubens TaxID=1108849 RepID=UPI001D7D10E1|nr:uncharacterized protein N7525_006337 [Penicillium rubens]KAF3016573.1 hypothetical protein E8E15_001114 [Penicillium rubens]KAJ5050170.1 hypothetical protein NUH16_008709 [Penicillium rubens]KAJ5828084.1 hypothetical protein N7525_006337 [Penicillium rubens]
MPENVAAHVKTRFLVFSDTHGLDTPPEFVSREDADVAIHCGDLTTESKLDEFKASIRFLRAVNAPLKLVIAGNHDFTMDIPVFQRKVAEAQPLDPQLVQKFYGRYEEARDLFGKEKDATGITFLDEGIHTFRLQNGALLNVYASPYTPSCGDWGFQYRRDNGHDFRIENVDVVMTHGPPKGILDRTLSSQRAGCQRLFEAIARAKPRPLMHCFGHIHEAWGAKLVRWRDDISPEPSHLTDIDHDQSVPISTLSTIKRNGNPTESSATSHCAGDPRPLNRGSETLFINAALEGSRDFMIQPPWLVDIELPAAV